MALSYSHHWLRKKRNRPTVTDDAVEYALQYSTPQRDRNWPDLLNAISRIPSSGRLLKVVYRRTGKDIKIITAYWLD
jgi:hypothetical protein